MSVTRLHDRVVAQVFTLKRFRRPENPKRCSSKGYFHVWRWFGGAVAPKGLRCQCGLLDDPPQEPRP